MWRSTCSACRVLSSALACALLGVGAQAREAPPRSAADVFQQLRAKGAGVHNRMSDADDARAALAEPEPAGADAPALLRYLLRRSNAHAILGDRDAQKRDLLRAMELAGADELLRYRAHGALFHFENNAGSLLAAREHARAQAAAARALRPPLQVGALTRLVYIANRLGDRAGAESAMAELDTLIRRLRRGQGWERSGEYWTSQQERARSQLQALAGDLPAAEQSAQTALAAAERYLAGLGERAATDEQRAEIASATGWIETIVRDLASTQAAQGKLLAAELTARRALQLSLKRIGFAAATTARSLQLLARTLVEQGRYVEGEQLARESLRAADAAGLEGSSHVLVLARESLGNALAMQLRWAEAERVFAERVTALDKADPALRKEVRLGNFNWALALIKTGRHERARALLETMRRRYASFGDESANARIAYCRGFLGLSYVETGLVDEALAEFRASIPVILEAAYRDLREDREGPARVARMNYILEGYMRALAEKSRAGPDPAAAAEIFRLADFARGSRVQRALTLGSARAAARDPALLRLVGEDERLLDRVTVLSGILGGLVVAPEERRLDQTINQMRLDLAQIERQRAGIRERIAREFPDYAGLVAPRPVTLDDARRALQPGEALLSLYLAEDRAYAWGLAPGRATAFAVVPVRRDEIARTVAGLRQSLDVGNVALERFPEFDVAAAHRLYAQLVQPVESALQGARTLVVAPHAALAQLPFAVLVTAPAAAPPGALPFEQYRAVPWLLRRAAIVQLPAVSSLLTLARIPAAQAKRAAFIGFGDPLFGGVSAPADGALRNLGVRRAEPSADLAKLPPLPDTRTEVLEIARALGADPEKDVFLGAAASERNVRSAALAERRVIAFATHGLVPGDLDGLTQPALALANPAVAGDGGDGLLTMEEILGLRVNADWVVLSACNTAAAGGAGEEAVSGLGRAFFFAGARALLASNWPVETVSARLLTTDLFRRQAADPKLTRAEALRQSMLELLDRGRTPAYAYAHPMFWAPFSLIGDGN